MAAAVMEEAFKGRPAPTKYLLEVAGVYPPVTDGEQATQEEDCLAKTLLERLNIPKKPALEEDEEPAGAGNVEVDDKAEGAGDKIEDGKAGAVAATGEPLDPTTLGTEESQNPRPFDFAQALAAKDAARMGRRSALSPKPRQGCGDRRADMCCRLLADNSVRPTHTVE